MITSWYDLGYPILMYIKRPWLSTMTMLFIKWIFFYHWTKSGASHYFEACRSPPRFHQWISCSMRDLKSHLHDDMNTTSSQIKVLDQFHMNVLCMVTLSCFKYSTKFERHCFSVNLHGRLESLQTSLVNRAWLMIFGTTSVANSWNFAKVSLSRF